MGGKMFYALKIGIRALLGATTAYYVLKATDKKSEEMIDKGGVINATLVGAGQTSLAAAAGMLAFWVVP